MPLIKHCLICDAEFITYPSEIKRGNGKYCSKNCSNKMTRRGRIMGGITPEKRFFYYVDKGFDINGCWEWTGHKNHGGYGRVRRGGKDLTAHRYSWMIHHGEIPVGMLVCHSCDNPRCVNPAHLFLGSHRHNAQDRSIKKRNRNQSGSKHNCAKLTEPQVLDIRNRLLCHEEGAALAKEFNVSPMTISNIKLRKNWVHI